MRVFTSLRFRLILLVLLAILPLAGMSVYSIRKDRRSAGEETAADALNLARLAASSQEDLVNLGQQLLFTLSQLDVVRASDPAACNVLVSPLLRNFPNYTNILVVSRDGRPRCSAIPLTGSVNYADRDWFQGAMQTRDFTIGSFVIGRITGKPSLPLAFPILDSDGQPQAMVVIALDLGWVSAMPAELDLPPGSTVTLVDTQGNVLGRYPDSENWLGKNVGAVPLVQQLLVHQSEGTIEDAGLDGVLRVYGYVPVQSGGQNWGYLFIGIPSQIAYAAADQTLRNSLIAFGLVAAFALATAWVLGEFSIIRRTQALVRAAKRLEAGDLSVRTGMRYGAGEISQLGRAFDEMAETLQQRETSRKQAEEALREREVFIKTVLDNLPVGVAVNSVDPNVTFHYMNDNFPRFYRTTREKLADPDAFWSAVYEEPGFREEMKKRVLDDLASGNPERMSWVDVPITHKGEKPSFITARNIPIPDNPLMVSTVWDVTERKNLEDSLRQRLTELDTLHTVSTVLRTVQTRDEALPILLDEILTALETDAGAIWLYQADSGELHSAVERGWFGQLDKTAMKPGEGIAGTVFDSGQAHLSTEVARDPLARSLQVGEIPAGWGGICLPIRSGVVTVGVLFVSLPLPRQITPEQEKLLESLGGMAGATLHRMSLHEETVRQLDRLEALRSIDLAISASMDLRVTLNVLLEQVARQLNVDAADVLLLNPHTQTLDYVAGRGFRTHSAETAKILLGEDFAGRAALERCTVQIDDLSQIQRSPHFSALWAGEDFAAYFGVPLIVKAQVRGVLEVYHRTSFHPASDWINFLETIAGQAAIAIDNSQLFENLQRSNADLALAYDTTIEGWSHALDLRDEETEGHTQRVTELTLQLAKAMGMGDEKLVHIRRGGLLHDIGKMGVPDGVLLKPGKLTDEEWVLMRKHPALAYELLSPIAYLREALDIPYCHHEKWDGTGYPRGLKGEQIPLAARLFAVVDVWDALRSDRPYRNAWDEEKVREHVKSLAGTHFDPNVVQVFLRLME